MAINDEVTPKNVGRLLNPLRRNLDQDGLMAGNRHLQDLLRRGKKFNAKHGNGTKKPVYADLIDFESPENNAFVAVNQMRVTRGPSVRPDLTLLVNGLPLVHGELKSLPQDTDYTDAISDLRGLSERAFAQSISMKMRWEERSTIFTNTGSRSYFGIWRPTRPRSSVSDPDLPTWMRPAFRSMRNPISTSPLTLKRRTSRWMPSRLPPQTV